MADLHNFSGLYSEMVKSWSDGEVAGLGAENLKKRYFFGFNRKSPDGTLPAAGSTTHKKYYICAFNRNSPQLIRSRYRYTRLCYTILTPLFIEFLVVIRQRRNHCLHQVA
jgi:hypothetical protein